MLAADSNGQTVSKNKSPENVSSTARADNSSAKVIENKPNIWKEISKIAAINFLFLFR